MRARKAKIIMPNNFRRFLLAAVDDGVLALTLNCVCVLACVCVCECVSREDYDLYGIVTTLTKRF